jgi:hypothetical protein
LNLKTGAIVPRFVVIAVAIVFALKVALLAWIGPVYSDDSAGYSDYAGAMLASIALAQRRQSR